MATPQEEQQSAIKAHRAMNIVGKWRIHFTGWQLGTRAKGDPESDAVRDINEARLIMRIEVSALVGLMLKKGIFTSYEWTKQLAEEAEALEKMLEERWPGIRATEDGLAYQLPLAAETMKRHNFKK